MYLKQRRRKRSSSFSASLIPFPLHRHMSFHLWMKQIPAGPLITPYPGNHCPPDWPGIFPWHLPPGPSPSFHPSDMSTGSPTSSQELPPAPGGHAIQTTEFGLPCYCYILTFGYIKYWNLSSLQRLQTQEQKSDLAHSILTDVNYLH